MKVRAEDLTNLLHTLNTFGKSRGGQPGHKLYKRGLFDAIGGLGNYLFGLVDSNTFHETTDVIDTLSQLSEEERETLNLHSHILNVTMLHLTNIETNQNRAIQAINHIATNLGILNRTMMQGQSELYDLNNNLNLVSAISYGSSAINDLDYKFRSFENGLK